MLLYFAAGRSQPVNLDTARQLAPQHFGARDRCASAGVTCGPDGGRGYVFADPRLVSDDRVRIDTDQQSWRQIGPEVWLGRYTQGPLADPPRPASLAREQPLRGHLVELADGQQWLCPIARAVGESEGELAPYLALPTRSEYLEGRWRRGSVVGRYQPLWDAAERFAASWSAAVRLADPAGGPADAVTPEGSYALDFDGLHDAAALALSANYRLGPHEIGELGLLSEPHAVQVLLALIDHPTLLAWLKKKQARDRQPSAV